MMTASDRLGADPTQAGASPSGVRAVSIVGNQIDSRELFTMDREIVIAHGDDTAGAIMVKCARLDGTASPGLSTLEPISSRSCSISCAGSGRPGSSRNGRVISGVVRT